MRVRGCPISCRSDIDSCRVGQTHDQTIISWWPSSNLCGEDLKRDWDGALYSTLLSRIGQPGRAAGKERKKWGTPLRDCSN